MRDIQQMCGPARQGGAQVAFTDVLKKSAALGAAEYSNIASLQRIRKSKITRLHTRTLHEHLARSADKDRCRHRGKIKRGGKGVEEAHQADHRMQYGESCMGLPPIVRRGTYTLDL
jgi:hypothetical protein